MSPDTLLTGKPHCYVLLPLKRLYTGLSVLTFPFPRVRSITQTDHILVNTTQHPKTPLDHSAYQRISDSQTEMVATLRRSARIKALQESKADDHNVHEKGVSRLSQLPLEVFTMVCDHLPVRDLRTLCFIDRATYTAASHTLHKSGIFQINIMGTPVPMEPLNPGLNMYYDRINTTLPKLENWNRIQNVSFHIMAKQRQISRDYQNSYPTAYCTEELFQIHAFSGSTPLRDTCHITIDLIDLQLIYFAAGLESRGRDAVWDAIKGLSGFKTVRIEFLHGHTSQAHLPGEGAYDMLQPADLTLVRDALEPSLGPSTYWTLPMRSWPRQQGIHNLSGLEFRPLDYAGGRNTANAHTWLNARKWEDHLHQSSVYWSERHWKRVQRSIEERKVKRE